jgi:hypothetical protein
MKIFEPLPRMRFCSLLLLLTVYCAACSSRAPANAGAPARASGPLPPLSPIIAASKITLSDYPLDGPQAHQMVWVTRPLSRRKDPTNSTDSHFDWWPHRDTNEWIEAALTKPKKISGMQLYWFDDSQKRGGCSLPVSWRAFYKDHDQWKPIKITGPYTVTKNQFDTITFKPVTTSGLRLEVQLQPDWSGGIEAWKLQ